MKGSATQQDQKVYKEMTKSFSEIPIPTPEPVETIAEKLAFLDNHLQALDTNIRSLIDQINPALLDLEPLKENIRSNNAEQNFLVKMASEKSSPFGNRVEELATRVRIISLLVSDIRNRVNL